MLDFEKGDMVVSCYHEESTGLPQKTKLVVENLSKMGTD
jgi:hypothetical protein